MLSKHDLLNFNKEFTFLFGLSKRTRTVAPIVWLLCHVKYLASQPDVHDQLPNAPRAAEAVLQKTAGPSGGAALPIVIKATRVPVQSELGKKRV